jgi:hypothetical protein
MGNSDSAYSACDPKDEELLIILGLTVSGNKL